MTVQEQNVRNNLVHR